MIYDCIVSECTKLNRMPTWAEPEPENKHGPVDESIEVSEQEEKQWIEIERLLKLVKPMRLQNAKQRQDQIRKSLVAMSAEERAVAVERLAAALEQ